MKFIHKNLALGRWQKMPYYLKIGNIASEVNRASNFYKMDDKKNMRLSLERVLELIDLSISNRLRLEDLRETLRLREILADYFNCKPIYKNKWEQINEYLLTLYLTKRLN